jgi:hypothetical protein
MTTLSVMRKQGEGRRMNTNENFSARIDAELIELLKQRADDDDRTISATLNRILREALQPPQARGAKVRERSTT